MTRCKFYSRSGRTCLREIAYHEAGHAVVSYLVRVPFTSIVVNDDETGCVRYGPGLIDKVFPGWRTSSKVKREFVTRHMSTCLAGPLAETIHTGCWVDHFPMDNGDDEAQAFDTAEGLYPAYTDVRHNRLLNRIRFETLQVLMCPEVWRAVEALAGVLIERRKLNGKQAWSVIREALPETESQGTATQKNVNVSSFWKVK